MPSDELSGKHNSLRRCEHRQTSPSTMGPQTPVCGWRIIAWPAAWWGSRETTSSYSTSPFTSPRGRGPGSSTYQAARFTTGPTSGRPSSGISRAPTNALGALGTSIGVSRRAGKAFGTTSGGSPKRRMSSPTPRTPT